MELQRPLLPWQSPAATDTVPLYPALACPDERRTQKQPQRARSGPAGRVPALQLPPCPPCCPECNQCGKSFPVAPGWCHPRSRSLDDFAGQKVARRGRTNGYRRSICPKHSAEPSLSTAHPVLPASASPWSGTRTRGQLPSPIPVGPIPQLHGLSWDLACKPSSLLGGVTGGWGQGSLCSLAGRWQLCGGDVGGLLRVTRHIVLAPGSSEAGLAADFENTGLGGLHGPLQAPQGPMLEGRAGSLGPLPSPLFFSLQPGPPSFIFTSGCLRCPDQASSTHRGTGLHLLSTLATAWCPHPCPRPWDMGTFPGDTWSLTASKPQVQANSKAKKYRDGPELFPQGRPPCLPPCPAAGML
nr:uncharacterized protein LOC105875423 [Microcebus murinus]XP_020138229.1 uncharacterized protein LOC105875423 [Microcebus murinus]XP_020138230.1 uncharacterized protein LOC105875423 [Microcebus murinus]